MGGDCCGGGPASASLEETLAEISLQSVPHASAPSLPAKTEAQIKEDKQPYYDRRIALFEQFRQRVVDALEAAKAANEPITGENLLPYTPADLARHHACYSVSN